jgi:cellulose synthase/poly-beta-1,6-N-acetylglucosamine synthase-like glycosyltransferase
MINAKIEIPLKSEKTRHYRFFEILPGVLSWSILAAPVVLSLINPSITAIIIIAYFLLWFVRAIGLNVRVLQGYGTMQKHQKFDWMRMNDELEQLTASQPSKTIPKWHQQLIKRVSEDPTPLKPSEVIHAVIIANWNESEEILEPTIQAVIDSSYGAKKMIVYLAYEERGGPVVAERNKMLVKKYQKHFRYMTATQHIDGLHEVVGKGGNITYAGRQLEKYLKQEGIDPKTVMVTTLDADNRPHKHYFAALTYTTAASVDPIRVAYQPIPSFTNNIWDAPAPMRVIATGNSFWNLILSLRPHMLRNFSSHAQSMQALIDMDFWSVRTIVEDGHQFWRSYFKFDGNYEVYPIYLPIYQDAVLSDTYVKTFKAQFIQIRRWAYGASDIAYVADKAFFTPNKAPKMDRFFKFMRLLEGHVSWATSPLILAFAAFVPLYFNAESYAANQLPIIASRIQTLALAGIFITFFLSFKTLPPKPARYKRHRSFFMIIQWVLLPVTTIAYNALAALTSQTRLMFGKYLEKFDLTEKSVKK